MLVIILALARLSFVHCRAANDHQFLSKQIVKAFSEDDMTPDFTEQLGSHDHTKDIKKRSEEVKLKTHLRPHNVIKTNSTEKPVKKSIPRHAPDDKKRHRIILRQETDVYDREDHVTQYLSDQLVNTDSEITSLQASDLEEDRDFPEVKEDWFFAFLTGQEKAVEFEGAWLRPVFDDPFPNNEDQQANVINDNNVVNKQ